MLRLEEESVSDPAQQKMIVVRMETYSQSELLDIVPIQVRMPMSQTTAVSHVPPVEPSPPKSPSEKINEETTKCTPQSQKPAESTSIVPPAPSKINPPPEATTTLMMIFNTASYIAKQFSAPSFSLDFTDSSQEETLTQGGNQDLRRKKSPETPILIEELEELVKKIASAGVKVAMDFAEGKSPPHEKQPADQIFKKIEAPTRSKELSAEMKEKCYLWATNVKTYWDGSTNEYDPVCTLNAQEPLILSKIHFASLAASKYIEVEGYVIFRMRVYTGGTSQEK
ncbi:uncharacterized protein [Arachis hypogaea]|uniref:uncharacterized protein isoform X2 n=1 Tax=Arachis hypogaea TaxID=3818 RepID=UPI003B21F5E6